MRIITEVLRLKFEAKLSQEKVGRQAAYRELFRYQLVPGLMDDIRKATIGNYLLGSPRFQQDVARALGCRVMRGQSGRPRERVETDAGELFETE